ncbi:TonB-dependent receptor [Hymenobacter arizonensis]|uniref:Carboxypeptidase regulatory-like domain-containing protein n=1 Tax=Hymenobacter arizonensis TaxID=1227077 RepID=A0A1I5ZZY0_HYMAR|nr:TonB-dependent receptor [Hymenobacter arizonensis]SFQ61817.1 Carboxypeptidase regulatory-like domain-containing protein [Hymenobacter arizonensis]
MNSLYLRHFFLVALLLFAAHLGWSQGTTTAAMSGVITDSKGEGLPGATVIALHTPTNTQYVAPTNSDGRFNIQNMRVGGPYTVRVTFVGFQDLVREGLNLSLGQNLRFDQKLSDATTELSEVTVSGRRDPVMNAGRTGAATTVQREQIERLPTISRSFDDFTRLTPQANGQSFGGRSGSYNNITIDGAIFNNSFGLSSTVGGQANAQPISLDAIDQIQVSIAPFDVRQGAFTGAGINAVTRSGTNKVSASIYGFYRNQNFVGNKVGDFKQDYPNFNLKNYGFRLGGPIIKDKLFFFINGEQETRVDPPTGNFSANRAGAPAPGPNSTTSAAAARDLDILRSFLVTNYGYDPGAYENYDLRTFSRKATAKLDWNITSNHRLSLKYNYLNSYRDVPPSGSGAIGPANIGRSQSQFGLPFFSSYYTINNNLNSVIAELNSTFSSRFANNFTAGYSAFRDFRESPGGGSFPLVDIGTSTNRTAAGGTVNATNSFTTFGYEPFSAFNVLNSDVYQIGDNFTAFLGKHNVTVGTYNEFYKFTNGFSPNYYGAFAFNGLDDFYAAARTQAGPLGYTRDANGNPVANTTGTLAFPQRYQLSYSALPDGSFPFAETKAAQFGLYAQDEWSPRSNLRVTVGLRGDLPVIYSDIARNENAANLSFRDGVKLETNKLPDRAVLLSPRVGVNWDVNDDRKTQLRGGTGIFTGRIPFVWLSNQAGNNGVQFGSFNRGGAQVATATNPDGTVGNYFDPNVDRYRPSGAAANTQYNLAVTARDFKFPQVWRTNIAVDQEIAGGVIATIEALYTKDLNAVYFENVNLPNSIGRANGADNRPIFYTFGAINTTGANAGLYTTAPVGTAPNTQPSLIGNNRIYNGQGGASSANPVITDAILMKNTNKGYSYSVTGQLQKSFSSGLYASVAYTYTDARSVNDGGTIAQTNWRDRPASGDPNANVLSYTNFLQQHRFIGSVSYRREYINHLATTISMFYEAAPAGRFSYTYAGDMNGDGSGGSGNDLMYVPRNQSEIALRDISIPAAQGGGIYSASEQWNDLNNYINQDDYLRKRRGEYAERNGAVRPWQNRLDLRLLQDIFTDLGENRNTLQFSIDVFNIGNLLNSNWGTFRTPNVSNPLTFVGYDQSARPNFTFPYLTAPSRASDGTVTPGVKLTDTFRRDTGGLGSRWQAQVGIRYIFN